MLENVIIFCFSDEVEYSVKRIKDHKMGSYFSMDKGLVIGQKTEGIEV